jgi:hypothetical protein
MTQASFLMILTFVMIAAGILGGIVNYLLERKADPEGSSVGKSIAIGIVASFLVPLFLNMISSNLTDQIRGTPTSSPDLPKILVFAGFCLVAAISSTAFIKTLSDRILQEAKEAKKVAHQAEKKVSEVQSEMQPLVDKETEDEVPSNAAVPLAGSVALIDPNERNILQNLANGKWVLRTRTGVAKETGIGKSEVDRMMDDLRKRELVDYRWIVGKPGEKKRRWYITRNGRDAILATIPATSTSGQKLSS